MNFKKLALSYHCFPRVKVTSSSLYFYLIALCFCIYMKFSTCCRWGTAPVADGSLPCHQSWRPGRHPLLVPSHYFPLRCNCVNYLQEPDPWHHHHQFPPSIQPPKNGKWFRCCTLAAARFPCLTHCQNLWKSFTQEVLWELYWRQGVNLLGAFQTNLVFRRFQSLVKHEWIYILSFWGYF